MHLEEMATHSHFVDAYPGLEHGYAMVKRMDGK